MKRRLSGVSFNGDGLAEITVWAPLAESVELLLPARDMKIPINTTGAGQWRIITNGLQPGDRYKFILNGGKALPDPASLSQPDGVHEASEAVDLHEFYWTDNAWHNHPLEEYIFYELHTGTFSPTGDFKGIEEKLDYLKELGITTIELMPVTQFSGDRNWGYDGVYPFAVQNSYGGARGLQQLVNKCHEKGIAVVLDVVYNHLGPEGNYLAEYGPYFTDKYHTPWGSAINFDDAWCDGVRQFFVENALMWFRDFHIDALRLDAVHAIKDFSPIHILKEIKEKTDELMELTGRRHYLIVECDLNDTRFINPVTAQGYGMDAQWIDEFHHALRVTTGNERSGYYADFEGINHLAKAYRDAYVYDGMYSPHRKKTFGVKAEHNSGKQFVVFSQNHDQVGNRMLGERTAQLVSFEMQKLMAAAVMVSPYLPLLFMGEEWAASNPFLYFTSHTDKELAEAVRKGRKAEFASFHAKGEAPDPQAEETFNQCKLPWQELEREQHAAMLGYYKALIALRKEHPALNSCDREQLDVTFNADAETLTLRRWQEDEELVCFMNFSKKHKVQHIPAHLEKWEMLFSSADKKWGGKIDSPKLVFAGDELSTAPESIIIYKGKNV